MEKSPHSPQYPLKRLRRALFFVAFVSFPFNLSAAIIDWDRTASINQLIPVTLSGISALLILGYHKKRGYGRYSAPEMLLDAFFAVYLILVYIVVLALSTSVREHMVCVYGNLACLVSGLLHGHAFARGVLKKYITNFIRKFSCRRSVVCPRCNNADNNDRYTDEQDQETGVVSNEYRIQENEGIDSLNVRGPLLVDEEDAASTDGLLGRRSEETVVEMRRASQ
ncbi:hypothetical protein AWENTII_005663 [Aspergillus wentii]|nr:hypothetical protein MW887_000424 [Aspergillus wentii]